MNRAQAQVAVLPDMGILLTGLALMLVGLVAISSASIEYADLHYASTTFHTVRHLIYLAVAAVGAVLVYRVPLQFWQRPAGSGCLSPWRC